MSQKVVKQAILGKLLKLVGSPDIPQRYRQDRIAEIPISSTCDLTDYQSQLEVQLNSYYVELYWPSVAPKGD